MLRPYWYAFKKVGKNTYFFVKVSATNMFFFIILDAFPYTDSKGYVKKEDKLGLMPLL